MALINYIIPTQNVEIIRDTLAYIVALEVENQRVLRTDSELDINTYIERFVSYDNTELPAVNVTYNKTAYVSKDLSVITGEHEFFIDVIVSTEPDEGERGDTKATKQLHKLIGIIKYILESQEYVYLTPLPIGLIGNRYVASVKVFNPDTPYNPNVSSDSLYTIAGRIVFMVRANDINIDMTSATIVESIYTNMTIDESQDGYKIEVLNN